LESKFTRKLENIKINLGIIIVIKKIRRREILERIGYFLNKVGLESGRVNLDLELELELE
jgi:hypothetical protein